MSFTQVKLRQKPSFRACLNVAVHTYMKCVHKKVSFSFFFQYFIYEFFIKYSHNSVYYFISQHCIVLLVIVMFQQHKVFPWWFTANYWGILANSKCCLHDAMPDFYPFVFLNTGASEPGDSPPTPIFWQE